MSLKLPGLPGLPSPTDLIPGLGGGDSKSKGSGGGLGLPDPLGLFGEGGLPDPLGLFKSADGANSSSSSAGGESQGEELDIFNPLSVLKALSPASILGGEGPPLPPGLRELLSAARPEAAGLVGGFPV